jgi:DNA-binding SARP family transcriptional activator
MDVGVLGPLEVHDGDTSVVVSGARLRRLLTVLAAEAPRVVPATVLVDTLWGDDPPADQANALQSLVSRLRKALGDGDLVQQSPAGYRLLLAPQDVDLHRFEALARAGRDALRSGDAGTAQRDLTEALALWRGDPVELADSGYAALVARLEEQRLDARADLIEARLALGWPGEVVAELECLVTAHPMRQHFAVLLVRALHAGGRSDPRRPRRTGRSTRSAGVRHGCADMTRTRRWHGPGTGCQALCRLAR